MFQKKNNSYMWSQVRLIESPIPLGLEISLSAYSGKSFKVLIHDGMNTLISVLSECRKLQIEKSNLW